MCYYCRWFPYISIYAGRQLNVIDSGKIVLVTTPLNYKVTCFRLLYTDIVMYIPIHDMGLSATVLAGNNKITLSKVSTTKTLNNLENAYLFYYKNA